MRVLLTGAAGFVGSHLARLLVREGCEVAALVRPGTDLRRLGDVVPKLTLVEGDLLAPGGLGDVLGAVAPEVCVHLAWCTHPGRYLHAAENVDYLAGSAGLLRALDGTVCRRIVLAGTCVEYDTDLGYLTEDSPVRPRSLYAACKHALWLLTERHARARGRSAATARLFLLYGPWEPEARLVPSVIRALLNGRPCPLTWGEQTRDFLHVEDVAAALWAVARSGVEGPVNVGSSTPVSVAAVAREIGGLLGRPDLLHFGARPASADDPPCLVAEPGPLRETLGWSPRYDLRAGLAATIEWWKGQP